MSVSDTTEDVASNIREEALEYASTRPTTVSRHTARPKRKVTRFTLDLEREQHIFLKSFSLHNEVQSSLVMRTLLYLLETDKTIAMRVIEEIFAEDVEDDANDESDSMV